LSREMLVQGSKQTTAAAALQTTGSSICNPDAAAASISKAGQVSLSRFAWFILAYNVAVILWGAYVRASGSGAGCGSHWPLCNGAILPATAQMQTAIEFTHRVTSAVSLVLVVILLIWCWRRTTMSEWPRYSAIAAAALLFNEALLGALLVLLDQTEGLDRSAAHAAFLCLHFGNTLVLLAALALTAKWLSKPGRHFAVLAKPYERVAIGLGLVSRNGHRNDWLAGQSGGHNLSFRLPATRADARLLGEQPRPVASQAPSSCCSGDWFHVRVLAALEPSEKARSFTMAVRSCRCIDNSDCSRHNERDPVGSYLAADDASPRRRDVLDSACTRIH